MNMSDSEAIRLKLRAMMRATLNDEKVGDDSLGQAVELVRNRESVEGATDEELRSELRRLHDEPLDPDDPQQVADEFKAMQYGSMGLTRPVARGRAAAKFVANIRQLSNDAAARPQPRALLV
ncbi:hypothetical protein [Micromonospora cremea]|uniref:hypothetical protein n=1 Tax=Micromonospora cremea TaxID=709881 RepID=UPI000940FD88|nr:hypothetical protein [Micromonospora cremea]